MLSTMDRGHRLGRHRAISASIWFNLNDYYDCAGNSTNSEKSGRTDPMDDKEYAAVAQPQLFMQLHRKRS
jgi:hypothetical protein